MRRRSPVPCPQGGCLALPSGNLAPGALARRDPERRPDHNFGPLASNLP
jgi:hypothetical protein